MARRSTVRADKVETHLTQGALGVEEVVVHVNAGNKSSGNGGAGGGAAELKLR
jgi:hypothetical protein